VGVTLVHVQFGPPVLPGISRLEHIGDGGFADVYRGYQDHIGRAVAVKVLRVAVTDKAAADQFRVEAQALGRLDGFDNVLRVHGADVLPDGRPYLITELCDGSLHQLISKRGPLATEQATAIGYLIARGLLAAHGQGILHGDVAPKNVLLRPSGVPVLADFGMAVLRDYGVAAATGRTLTHAAPEILRDDAVLTPASDVYGLGSTIYAALAGQSPFPLRTGENSHAHVLRVLTEPPPELSRADVPARVRALLSAMLAKSPDDRPTLTEVAQLLAAPDHPHRSISTKTMPTEPTLATVRHSAPAVALPPWADPDDKDNSWHDPWAEDGKRRRRWLLPGAATGAALAIGLVVIQLAGGEPDQSSTVTTPDVPASTTAPPTSVPVPVSIELFVPVDRGDVVELSWRGPPNVRYSITIAPRERPTITELVNQATTRQVPVDPGVQYCFRIEGTDGRQPYVSNVQGIRGAVCRF
jgi:serine/threonine protein kinase